MPVISVINQKGGCGKTTTAIHLAACLGQLDRRVLLVDLDPQGHASLGLNIKPEYVTRGMTEVLTQGIPLEDVIHQAISPNLDLAPANITLSTVEQLLADATHKEKRLITALGKFKRTYDYVSGPAASRSSPSIWEFFHSMDSFGSGRSWTCWPDIRAIRSRSAPLRPW
jgi:chromosome partitioning protein